MHQKPAKIQCLQDPDHMAIASGLFFTTKNLNTRFDRGLSVILGGKEKKNKNIQPSWQRKQMSKTWQRNEKERQPGERVREPETGREETVESDVGKRTEEGGRC